MKRSQINDVIAYTMKALEKKQFPLPPFAYYPPEAWGNLEKSEEEIVENMLGWDITDFGRGDFHNVGLTIFTFRNGNFYEKIKYPKPYAEKMLYVMDGQVLPFHYHWYKCEDIINRGGGNLEITLYNSTRNDFDHRDAAEKGEKGNFANSPVFVSIDAKKTEVEPGGTVILRPGQSISLMPGQYHQWKGIPGTGDIILFEVSATNDDTIDNRFYSAGNRIPEIEEDEPAQHLIFADYPAYTGFHFLDGRVKK